MPEHAPERSRKEARVTIINFQNITTSKQGGLLGEIVTLEEASFQEEGQSR